MFKAQIISYFHSSSQGSQSGNLSKKRDTESKSNPRAVGSRSTAEGTPEKNHEVHLWVYLLVVRCAKHVRFASY